MAEMKKVCIIGSGNWGSAVATIIGKNCLDNDDFDNDVNMWVFEEYIDGKKLTDIINESHENVKYLPGYTIPHNVKAVPDLLTAVDGAKLLVFVLPHQFIKKTCHALVGKIPADAQAIHLIKMPETEPAAFRELVKKSPSIYYEGFEVNEEGKLELISNVISNILNISVSALMGANLAHEVAAGRFGEATIASRIRENGQTFKRLFQTPWFRCSVIDDVVTTELCGALKNIVAVGAGFVDGLGYGDNTKAAVIRLGLMEMVAFCHEFYNCQDKTVFLESCGVADLVTTCYGGRHRKVAEAHVKTGKSFEVLEQEMLNGQILQGPQTSKKVHDMLIQRGIDPDTKYPLLSAIYKVCYQGMDAKDLFTCIQNHPEHM